MTDRHVAELNDLGTRRRQLTAELATVVEKLGRLVPAVHAGGMRQVDIVRATGYTREMIRRLCQPR